MTSCRWFTVSLVWSESLTRDRVNDSFALFCCGWILRVYQHLAEISQRAEHYLHLQRVQDASDCFRQTTDVGQCEGCLWSLVLYFLSPSAGDGVLADEVRQVAIAYQCICDLLFFLCLLRTRGGQVVCSDPQSFDDCHLVCPLDGWT